VTETRRYDTTRRREAAARTRRSILDAALQLFTEQGYTATTMAAIASAAGVAQDTIYASVGAKPQLFRLLIETAISGTSEAVPNAEERPYVQALMAEPTAAGKLEIYAAAVLPIRARMAPILQVLRQAAPTHPELAALWNEIGERRARNMLRFAEELDRTGGLGPGVTREEAADVLWATNDDEFYWLLVHRRGWTPERFGTWLAHTWKRLLLPAESGA